MLMDAPFIRLKTYFYCVNILIITSTEAEVAVLKKFLLKEGKDVTAKSRMKVMFTYKNKSRLSAFEYGGLFS